MKPSRIYAIKRRMQMQYKFLKYTVLAVIKLAYANPNKFLLYRNNQFV